MFFVKSSQKQMVTIKFLKTVFLSKPQFDTHARTFDDIIND